MVSLASSAPASDEDWPRLRTPTKEDGWELLDHLEVTTDEDSILIVDSAHNMCRSVSTPEFQRMRGNTENDSLESTTFDLIPEFCVPRGSLSFRDAIMSPSTQTSTPPPASTPIARRRTTKPRFVVTPIKRCIKSTNDLHSMGIIEEEVEGDTDAMEFYHRKAVGAKSRMNGQKLRPDELKRKTMLLQKRELQRSASKTR